MSSTTFVPAACSPALPLQKTALAAITQQAPGLAQSWQDLVERSREAVVEMHPELTLADCSPDLQQPSGLLLHACGGDGTLANLAVLVEKTVSLPLLRGFPGRASLRGLRLVGSRLLGAEPNAAIPAFAASLEQLLSGHAARYGCLLVEDLPIDSPWWRAFAESTGSRAVTFVAPQTRWFLRFPDSAETYWRRFSSKTRYNFRRQKRLLEHQWESITDASQVAAFLVAASTVSANSWQGKRLGLRVADDAVLRRRFETLARLGALRCYLLRSQGEPIAFAIGTQWNGRFILEEIGYDTRYADLSPGTVLWLDMLEDMFQQHTPELIDFGFGDGAYKQLFGTESTQSGTLLVVSCRWGPRLALGLNRLGTRLERAVRAGLRKSGVDGWIRKLYRR